jgi:hypothetical protein
MAERTQKCVSSKLWNQRQQAISYRFFYRPADDQVDASRTIIKHLLTLAEANLKTHTLQQEQAAVPRSLDAVAIVGSVEKSHPGWSSDINRMGWPCITLLYGSGSRTETQRFPTTL